MRSWQRKHLTGRRRRRRENGAPRPPPRPLQRLRRPQVRALGTRPQVSPVSNLTRTALVTGTVRCQGDSAQHHAVWRSLMTVTCGCCSRAVAHLDTGRISGLEPLPWRPALASLQLCCMQRPQQPPFLPLPQRAQLLRSRPPPRSALRSPPSRLLRRPRRASCLRGAHRLLRARKPGHNCYGLMRSDEQTASPTCGELLPSGEHRNCSVMLTLWGCSFPWPWSTQVADAYTAFRICR